MKTAELSPAEILHQDKVILEDGHSTNVYAARYAKDKVRVGLKVFAEPTILLDYCTTHDIPDAINGGFTMYHRDPRPTRLLGTYVLDGRKLSSVPFSAPKSGVKITQDGEINLIHVTDEIQISDENYFEAGPMIIKDGEILTSENFDYEGVSNYPLQMDDDWTRNRFPRAAIGTDDNFVYTIACDGYSPPDDHEPNSGMTLNELAQFMSDIGVMDALNLDGGSKATLVAGGRLRNMPRGGTADKHRYFMAGLPIMSAIIFQASTYN